MFNEPGFNAARLRHCPRCGTTLSAPVDVCPGCDTDPLVAASEAAAAKQTAIHRLQPHFYVFGTVAAVALAFAAFGIKQRAVQEPQAPAAAMHDIVFTTHDNASAEHVSVPAASAPSTQMSPTSSAPDTITSGSVSTPIVDKTTASHREQAPASSLHTSRNLHDNNAASSAANKSARADVARNLAIARANLDKNNLAPARHYVMTALAAQPRNGEAQQLKAELISREHERDSLLGFARLCARDNDWACAWNNAGRALTVDASSREARAMLAHAMAEQGTNTRAAFDPSLPGDQVR